MLVPRMALHWLLGRKSKAIVPQGAVEQLSGKVVHGRELLVCPFVAARDRAPPVAVADDCCNVYVKNLGPSVRAYLTSSVLRSKSGASVWGTLGRLYEPVTCLVLKLRADYFRRHTHTSRLRFLRRFIIK